MNCGIAVGLRAGREASRRRGVAEAAEDRPFVAPAGAGDAGDGLGDAIGQAAERQRLQPHVAGPGERGEEQALAAEERRLHPADELDVVVDRRLHRDQAAGVDAQRLARLELQLVQHAAGVDEGEAVALQALHDEALAAEQAGADLPLEGDADRDALGGAEERVLLADQLAAELS